MKSKIGFILLSLILLAGCYVNPSLLLVGLPDATKSAQFVADGEGENARFGSIESLEIDSQGNLYVLDLGPERNQGNIKILTSATVRKVTPEGKVTTLIGRGTKQTIIGYSSMILRNDILYLASAGCLLRVDLKQDPLAFKPFYGTCLTEEELLRLQEQVEKTETPIPVETTFENIQIESIMPEKTIYFLLYSISNRSRTLYNKLTPDEKIIPEPDRRYFPAESLQSYYMVINSKDVIFAYSQVVSHDLVPSWPRPPQKGSLYQVLFRDTFNASFDLTPIYQDKLTNPGVLCVDNQDYLYVKDSDDLIKRVSPQGEVRIIGSTTGAQGPQKGPVNNYIVNPQRTWLYFASSTAIYKIPLPPPGDS